MKILNLSCFKKRNPGLPRGGDRDEFVRLFRSLNEQNRKKVYPLIKKANCSLDDVLWLIRAISDLELEKIALEKLTGFNLAERRWRKLADDCHIGIKVLAIQKLAQMAVTEVASTDPEIVIKVEEKINRPEVVISRVGVSEKGEHKSFISRAFSSLFGFLTSKKESA
ncbi:MAG: hypothetical protein H6779_00655 [Candidatus Nomurabacteria bacterium]|nr:hypothetical protein [Candidatus Nomurabacteria bacterium]USN87940.1 MAG: hypothetical protein H6779_00655 [Candidatus Nomurabacteria bacterium]